MFIKLEIFSDLSYMNCGVDRVVQILHEVTVRATADGGAEPSRGS